LKLFDLASVRHWIDLFLYVLVNIRHWIYLFLSYLQHTDRSYGDCDRVHVLPLLVAVLRSQPSESGTGPEFPQEVQLSLHDVVHTPGRLHEQQCQPVRLHHAGRQVPQQLQAYLRLPLLLLPRPQASRHLARRPSYDCWQETTERPATTASAAFGC